MAAPLVAEHSSRVPWATVVEARGLSSCGVRALELRLSSCGTVELRCSSACGTFPGQGSNPCLCVGRQILYHWTTRDVPFVFKR